MAYLGQERAERERGQRERGVRERERSEREKGRVAYLGQERAVVEDETGQGPGNVHHLRSGVEEQRKRVATVKK